MSDIYDNAVPPEDLLAGIPEEFLGGGSFFTQEEVQESPTPVDEEALVFGDQYKEDFQKLITLGKLTATFNWSGHSFKIRTLTTDEMLELGVLHQKYSNTIADVRAYAALLVAACVESVDNKKLPVPISSDITLLETRFNYVKSNYYSWTIDAIYSKYLELEVKVQELIQAMGKV